MIDATVPRGEPINDADETLDRICGQLEIYQARRGYRFGVESLLLTGFVQPGGQALVDLGTGSGVLPIVLTHFDKVARAVGLELQPALVDRARRSVAHNALANRVSIVQADMRSVEGLRPELPPAGFDRVVANPPYGRAGQGHANSDGEKARARHELTVSLPEVVAAAARLCAVRGQFCVVVPPLRLVELLGLCAQAGLRPARLRFVHGRVELVAKHCLLEAVRGGRMDLEVEPPLIVYTEEGEYTDEVKAMLYPAGGG